MASLYELSGDYVKFSELMEMEELEPEMQEALEEALDNLGEDIEIKLENYAKIIRNFESDIEGLKTEEARLASKRKTKENAIKNMKERMTLAMQQTGKLDIKTPLFSFKVQKNTPSVVLDVHSVLDIPEKYRIPQEPKIDKKLLKADIDAGADLDGIAHVERSESLRIR